MAKPNAIPQFYWGDDAVIVQGTRVRIVSRHGSTGNGTVTEILYWDKCPPTICLEMDDGTIYSERVQAGWGPDEQRIRDIGVFGGEIKEILTKH